MASIRNIMAGVLLAPGPVSTRLTVKNMSPAFKLSVSKAKFMSAANQLQSDNLGVLVVLDRISSQAHVFVKKTPNEIHDLLLLKQHSDLCTPEEYFTRYIMPTPVSVTERMKTCMIDRGLVSAESFIQVSHEPLHTLGSIMDQESNNQMMPTDVDDEPNETF